jgi:archaemetzincin
LFVSFDVPPLPEPGPDDWLANFDEPGQTFDEFVASRPFIPTETNNILYIQPLGHSDEFELPTLEELEVFYEAYFSMEAQILEPIEPADHDITERVHMGGRQLLTTDILNLLARRLPIDAHSLIAVTMIDLYPDDDWNFVFGQASLTHRVGVFSFARYESFAREQTLRRSFKVLAHEAGHMFGIWHCTYFHCLMNGSNHLGELDASPIHLCPVDMRKLYWAIGFDPVARYERLIEVYRSFELQEEVTWLEDRLRLSGF